MLQSLARVAVTITVCVLLALLAARISVSIPSGEARERLSAANLQNAGEIFEGIEVSQGFPAEGTKIRSVELQLATFARQNKGSLALQVSRLVDGRWKQLAVQTMLKRQIVDNDWQSFVFSPPIKVEQGQQIALTLTADLDAANAITWWTRPDLEPENHQLLINGKPRNGCAQFFVEYEPIRGKAGYRKMRPRLWRRLTIFLDPLGQTMLAGGFLLALFCFVHLSMHAPRARLTSSPRPGGKAGPVEVKGLIDYLTAACRPSTWRAAVDFLHAQTQRSSYRQRAQHGSLLLVGFCVLVLVLYGLARLLL